MKAKMELKESNSYRINVCGLCVPIGFYVCPLVFMCAHWIEMSGYDVGGGTCSLGHSSRDVSAREEEGNILSRLTPFHIRGSRSLLSGDHTKHVQTGKYWIELSQYSVVILPDPLSTPRCSRHAGGGGLVAITGRGGHCITIKDMLAEGLLNTLPPPPQFGSNLGLAPPELVVLFRTGLFPLAPFLRHLQSCPSTASYHPIGLYTNVLGMKKVEFRGCTLAFAWRENRKPPSVHTNWFEPRSPHPPVNVMR
uniref:(California timema) hypothetical protein n=1 Tax=Timema californicum TaxID=61474 RepID=A0A7R9J713_TIMCA|nr:unnamed protein product [Timema californicum]